MDDKATISILINTEVVVYQKTIPKKYKGYSGIYFLIKNNEIIYIGQSTNVFQRLKHYREEEYDWVGILWITKSLLNSLENSFIRKYQPKYNRTGNPKQTDDSGNFCRP